MARYRTFEDFYPFYLGEHSDPRSRALHYLGTSGAAILLGASAVLREPTLLAAVPFAGYGFAWVGHFFFERNRPATFRYPLWSLRGDLRMLFEAATGRLDHGHFRPTGTRPAASG